MLRSIWAVWEQGAAGMQSQAMGLAEALFATGGFALPQGHEVAFRRPYGLFPTHPVFASLGALTPETAANIHEPWPDLLIASGRKAAMLALAVQKASGGQTRTTLTQDPRANPRHWSLLVVPEHDPVRAPNVVLTQGAFHRVTRLKLESGADVLRRALEPLTTPRYPRLAGRERRG